MALKVISFNICCSNGPVGHTLEECAPRVIDVITKKDPDIIGFQEFTPRWHGLLDEFIKENGYELFIMYRAESNKEGTPMLWKKDKFECLDKGYFWLSDTPEVESKGWDEYGCHRICLWAKLKEKESGKVFIAANTHFGFGDQCQTDSARLILSRINAHGTDAVFVTADYNFNSEMLGYKEMTRDFVDVTATTTGDKTPTYHGYDLANAMTDDEIRVTGKTFGGHIDFCFANPKGMTPITGKVLRENFDGKFPSDHNAVYFELDIK